MSLAQISWLAWWGNTNPLTGNRSRRANCWWITAKEGRDSTLSLKRYEIKQRSVEYPSQPSRGIGRGLELMLINAIRLEHEIPTFLVWGVRWFLSLFFEKPSRNTQLIHRFPLPSYYFFVNTYLKKWLISQSRLGSFLWIKSVYCGIFLRATGGSKYFSITRCCRTGMLSN